MEKNCKTVYRIEHDRLRTGPYSTHPIADPIHDIVYGHNESNGHPNAWQDKPIDRCPHDGELFGFTSITQLHEWFTYDEIKVLCKNDFKVVKLNNVIVTVVGDKQCLFANPYNMERMDRPIQDKGVTVEILCGRER